MVSLAISFICTTQHKIPTTVLRMPARGLRPIEFTGQFEPHSGPKSGIYFTTNQDSTVVWTGGRAQQNTIQSMSIIGQKKGSHGIGYS
jgi:hypothetical protein